MPTVTEEEIRNAIGDGTIGAVSLDTNVFDHNGCKLNVAPLSNLDQFKDTPIRVLFSEIIARETKRHISGMAKDTNTKLASALHNHKKRWEEEYDIAALSETLGLNRDCDQAAVEQFEAYVEYIGATIIPVNGHVNIDRLTDLYFNILPPFEKKPGKKKEFPDALALLSLEAWANSHNKKILIVSRDGGWKEFADQSDCLICVEDIETTLNHFNQAGRFVAERAIAMLRNGEAPEFHHEIEITIQARLDDNDYSIDADSHLSLDVKPEHAALQHWEIPEHALPLIIAADDETVTFSIDLECIVEFCANFLFFDYDEIAKEYVSMGSWDICRENKMTMSAVITIAREFDQELKVFHSEITTQRIEAQFGYIEPGGIYEE